MRFGVTLPNLGVAGGPSELVELAVAAEEAGWDGVFVWDTVWSPDWDAVFKDDPARRNVWDPWVLLAAMAVATHRVRLGTMVSPLSRRRPWKVAAETATVDHLSAGRLILAVSLGWLPDGGFAKVNEETDRRVRAQRLDEALDIVTRLWSGDAVDYRGRHFQIDALPGPRSEQQPRIPIWVVGASPRPRSMERALRYDGILPAVHTDEHGWMQPSPAQLAPITESIRKRADAGYDIVVEGNTSRDSSKAAKTVRPYIDAGATWWLEGVWSFLSQPETAVERIRARISAGPPA
jgi:alkanesulfonate monooxygenase SsuD/methylene tetrahydromethanopterin reductase-like flavin-dependent oxidoreductase (luciferase family)